MAAKPKTETGAPKASEKVAPLVMPKTLGACADLLFTTREVRLKMEKEVAKVAARESEIREHLIRELPKADASGVSGKIARATRSEKIVAQVKDWPLFYAYIKKSGNFAMLQRRIGDAAIQEQWENKKKVPGVEPFTVVSISLGKAG